jgi:hypothetical protein
VVKFVEANWWTTAIRLADRPEKESEDKPEVERARGSASADVSVAGDGMHDVILRLDPPRDVIGRLRFEGAIPRPASQINVALIPATGAGEAHEARVGDDGGFSIEDVVPGRYFVGITDVGRPWTLVSAISAGVDTLDYQLEVPRDRDVQDLTLTLRDRPTQLSGTVTDAAAQPVNDRRVIIFASDERLWATANRIQSTMISDAGGFSFTDLRPGSYWLGVVADVEPDEWQHPEFLRRLIGASVPITLRDGENKTQDLRVK